MTKNQLKARLEELRSQARDKRRSAASRKQAAEEFRKLVALASQISGKPIPQDQGDGVTLQSPKVTQLWVQRTGLPPKSIHDDPQPKELSSGPAVDLDADPEDEPTERPDPWQADRQRLLEYLHDAEALGDEERIQYAQEQLSELDARDAEPEPQEEYQKPAESSDPIRVDFSGGHSGPVARSIEDFNSGRDFWSAYGPRAVAKQAKRIPSAGPRVIRDWHGDW